MLTLRQGPPITGQLEVKRSRFIAALARTDTVEQSRALITDSKELYPDARHHCSAYIIRPPGLNLLLHSNDDGEPAGTAGAPMLDVLRHFGVENVTAVVTRYFGGTLLGKGGLIRAYSAAVQQVLQEAPLVTFEEFASYRFFIPLDRAGKVESELRESGWKILGTTWTEDLSIDIGVAPARKEELFTQLATLIQRTVDHQYLGTIRTEVDIPGH